MKSILLWIGRIIFGIAFVVVLLVLLFGIPRFINIYEELGVALPLLTRLLIELRYLLFALILLIGAGLLFLERKYPFITSVGILLAGIILSIMVLLLYLPLFLITNSVT